MAKWKPGGPGRPPASAKKRVGRPRKNAAAQSLGRRGGAARSAKQNAARRRNARTAGRPAKVCIFCGKPAKGGHKEKRRDASCGMHGWTYRQRSKDSSVTRLAILEEIAALQRLMASIDATAVSAGEPEPPLPNLPPQQPQPDEPQEPPKVVMGANAHKPTEEPERRLDPATLDWREPEPDNKPADTVPF